MRHPAPPVGPRDAALAALLEVTVRGRSLSDALPEASAALNGEADRALAQELAYGVARWAPRLEALLDRTLERPLRGREREVRLALLLGQYQLAFTRIPPYAAVSETLALLERLGRPWAKGLANAVLRRLGGSAADPAVVEALEGPARWAHPAWLIDRIAEAWPERWQSILEANNQRAPMTLRVNRRRTDRASYLERLQAEGLRAGACAHAPDGLSLERPVPVERLPGFAAGEVSVQDAAAQLAALLLAPAPGDRVLDACAAPGGKTAHLLETQPEVGEVVSLDRDPRRIEALTAGLDRLGLRATVVCADAASPDAWWDGRPFQRILLDAPCSATGVIRRHPDIKLLRTPSQVAEAAAHQSRLLRGLWPLLARGGDTVVRYLLSATGRERRGGRCLRGRRTRRRRSSPGRALGPGMRSGPPGLPGGRRNGWVLLRGPDQAGLRVGVARVAVAVLLLLGYGSPGATTPGFRVRHVETELVDGTYRMSAFLALDLSPAVEKGLNSGVPITIIARVRVVRPRTYLWPETVVEKELRFELEYHALSRSYLVTELATGTTQSFRGLVPALAQLGTLKGVPLVAADRLAEGQEYLGEFQVWLDLESLPPPLRLTVYFDPAWRLSSKEYTWPVRR